MRTSWMDAWWGLLFLLAVAPAAAQYAPGYPGYGRLQSVRCESDDGRARRCTLDTSRGVYLQRQLSDARCVQGRTWGIERGGVWVTEGCRAEFRAGGVLGGFGYEQVFRCESDDGRWRTCGADTRGGVELVRQLSDAACIAGHSWGWDPRGVWVNDGCRAEFRTGGAHYGRPGYADSGTARTLRCQSLDGRHRQCYIYRPVSVRIIRQVSANPCIEGRTWGINRDGIWVDGGCRADFEVLDYRSGNGYGWAWGNRPSAPYGHGGRSLRCESSDGRTRRCNATARSVYLQRQLSDAQCIQGQTWDWDPAGIWVSRGCRAEFVVW